MESCQDLRPGKASGKIGIRGLGMAFFNINKQDVALNPYLVTHSVRYYQDNSFRGFDETLVKELRDQPFRVHLRDHYLQIR